MERRCFLFMATAAAALGTARPAAAQAGWPSRPVRLIVPWPPGGAADIFARLLQAPLAEELGQPVVVENRGGAGGAIGTHELVRAAPDGHAFGIIISTHASNPALVAQLPFDPVRDVTPVSLIATVPNIVVAHPSLPVRSMAELVQAAKSRPEGLTYSSSGNGTSQHFAGEQLRLRTGAQLTHVPFRGGGPANQAVVAGDVNMAFGNFPSILPFVQAGQVRALAVTSAAPNPQRPDLPTVAEALELPGYQAVEWYGVAGPAGVPTPILARFHGVLHRTMARPEVAGRIRGLGAEPSPNTPEEFGRFIAVEIERLGDIARRAGMRAE